MRLEGWRSGGGRRRGVRRRPAAAACLAKVRDVHEGLKQRVHVARRALVLQPDVPRLLLRVPVPPVDLRLDADAREDRQLVVVEEAGARVLEVGELHKLSEAPVLRAHVEVVVGVLDHVLRRVLVVEHRQREVRLPRPPLRQRRRVGNVEVDRELLHVVPAGEEEDAPVVLPALEDGAVQLRLLQLAEPLDHPRELAVQRAVVARLALGGGLLDVHRLRRRRIARVSVERRKFAGGGQRERRRFAHLGRRRVASAAASAAAGAAAAGTLDSDALGDRRGRLVRPVRRRRDDVRRAITARPGPDRHLKSAPCAPRSRTRRGRSAVDAGRRRGPRRPQAAAPRHRRGQRGRRVRACAVAGAGRGRGRRTRVGKVAIALLAASALSEPANS